ncbi:hypothetical protein, partial [Acinetobacter sp. NIOH-H-8]|uniref:hypothetical protein n=1 Tax=Acinetobacter sp. NIOH-H-8 TaxID=3342120 RepID=UPI003987AB15
MFVLRSELKIKKADSRTSPGQLFIFNSSFLTLLMITIIAGTNRPHSRARRISDLYAAQLREVGAEAQILDLAALPTDFTATALYD